MRTLLKLLVVAALGGLIVTLLERLRRSDDDAPEWPAWTPSAPTADTPTSDDPTSDDPVPDDPASDAAPSTGATIDDAAAAADGPTWVAARPDGDCPPGHPVKVKESSGIFHLPGMRNYERTNADRCYVDATAAEADGFRASKV